MTLNLTLTQSDRMPVRVATVTAIMPTFNRVAYITESLDGLLSQTRRPDQIIVVDDGSTDGTAEVVARYGTAVQYIRKSNGGKSTALNLALPQATGEFIWICDDDDIPLPNGLEHMLAAIEAHPEVDYVVGTYLNLIVTDAGERQISTPAQYGRVNEPNLKIRFLEHMFTLQYASLTRKSVYEELGGYDESLIRSQDYDMVLRISRHHKGVAIPEPIFLYRQHEGPRGSATGRFASDEKQTKWVNYNRSIFDTIWRTYNISEFTPTFALGSTFEQRAALLQRARVMASFQFWDRVILDLDQAERESSAPPHEEELELLKAMVHGRDAWNLLANDKARLATLSRIQGRSEHGRRMIAALVRPLLWIMKNSVKTHDWQGALWCARVLYDITKLGMAQVLLRRA